MAGRAPRTIAVPPESELAAFIAEAGSSGAPLIVEAGQSSYRLEVRPVAPGEVPTTDESGRATAPLTPAELYRAATEMQDLRALLRRLAVDAELREVAERLESSLRAQRPELFGRRGRLRATEVVRLIERAGGATALSGDELRALEERSDAAAASVSRAFASRVSRRLGGRQPAGWG